MSLIKNSVWNLGGYIIPTIIAIPALGYLARTLGIELFGIYTLAIAIVGYAGIFDVGLTRAIVREIALYRDDAEERKKIISTTTIFIAIFSSLGVVAIFLLIPNIVTLLKISLSHVEEVETSLRILVFSIPLFLLNQVWMSILEGDERFFIVNIQRSIGSSIIAGLPALCVLLQNGLVSAITGLVIGRIASVMIAYMVVRKEIIGSKFQFNMMTFKRLIFFGGWITVSNIISPVMVYFDRFVISSILGAKLVGFYTAPSEAVSRLGLLPGALSRAVFPRLSNITDKKDFNRQVKFSYALMISGCLPIVLIGILFSEKILNLWLGVEYAAHSAIILNILLIGFFFNSIAQIPFTIIQSVGKAKITALLHCFEIIPYLVMLYLCVSNYGIMGAAYAWTIRVIVDSLLLIFFSNKYSSR
ncbi:membrane protein [Buttiauxella brennerae ATCC 51605]|uniref:Putative O-antigen transporter n=1 Tax=Buttiauxella brennerae ATCC 51605 TaxID=1354251 RepID=A0A1B7INW3_9ENTR|nr:flippase [Buttiauxella brennerae]OAT31377.1 membrane protein [Buttiauxella brennerae ATCC 51605]